MNNTALAGLIVGAVVVAAAAGIVANSGFNPLQKYATVIAVEPAFDVTRTPREVCGDEATLAQSASLSAGPGAAAPSADSATPATPQATKSSEPKGADGATEADGAAESDCLVVYDTRSVQAGYDVTYELDGARKVVRMDRDPGDRIPVEDGKVVLTLR